MTSKQQDPQPSDNGQGPLEADSFITKDTAPWREFPASPIDSDRAGLVRAWSDTTKQYPNLASHPEWRRLLTTILHGDLENLADAVDVTHGEVELFPLPGAVPAEFLVALEEAILNECMER